MKWIEVRVVVADRRVFLVEGDELKVRGEIEEDKERRSM